MLDNAARSTSKPIVAAHLYPKPVSFGWLSYFISDLRPQDEALSDFYMPHDLRLQHFESVHARQATGLRSLDILSNIRSLCSPTPACIQIPES